MIVRSTLHPDFGVDEHGLIYVDRDVRWRQVRTSPGKNRYWRAQTTVHCRVVTAYVHVLICERFNGPRPSAKHEVRHLDGDRNHNWSSNLRWGTVADNAADRAAHGTQLYGERGPNAKLTDAQVAEIKTASGPQWRIATAFGVSQSLVSRIRSGHRWARSGPRVTQSVTQSECGAESTHHPGEPAASSKFAATNYL